jgi:protein-disulfide isomerase
LNRTRWIIFSVIIIGIITALILLSNGSKTDLSGVDAFAVQKATKQDGNIGDHVFGKADSKVTLIEYGDYQCPPCGSMYPIVKSTTEEYKEHLRYIFRNFPIPELHPNARAAAASAEAVGLQGKYWEMHNRLYETQSDWSDLSINERGAFFENLAKELGIDINKYKSDLAKSDLTKKIDYDISLGRESGVDATPTFFLNGKKLDASAYSSEDKFKQTIKDALKQAGY